MECAASQVECGVVPRWRLAGDFSSGEHYQEWVDLDGDEPTSAAGKGWSGQLRAPARDPTLRNDFFRKLKILASARRFF
jgi:hypothetical protein